jgi:hypothetical protein
LIVKFADGVIEVDKSRVTVAQDLFWKLKSLYFISPSQTISQLSQSHTFNILLVVSYQSCQVTGLEGAVVQDVIAFLTLSSTYFFVVGLQS